MDRTASLIHRRKGRYMAHILENFEENIEKLIPEDLAKDFKGIVRRKLNALAVDAVDIISLRDEGFEQNALGQQVRDQLHADGRVA